MSKQRAFVRYTKAGNIVPGSLILTSGSYPSGPGLWKEITTDLCCNSGDCPTPDFGAWRMVTGGVAGDGVVLLDYISPYYQFTIIGPNDGDGNGWVYLKKFFPSGATLGIRYNWTSFDDGGGGPPDVDWPVYWTSSTEPTGIPGDLTVRVEDTPSEGIWNITVNPGEWFAVGIYSDDSCCGRGFLEVELNYNP